MQERLTEKESLGIIQEMINKAKNQFSEDGTLYLLWGWVILACSFAYFVLDVVVDFKKPWIVWSLTWVVAGYMMLYLWKKDRSRKVKTYTEELLGYVWLCFVIMMMISFFLLQKFIPEFWRYNYLFVLLCYGMPTFLSGIILQFRLLVVGGVFCWLLAIIAGFTDFHYHPLFVSAAVIVAWIIPGYSLRARFRKDMI